jgi:trehalose 6-phosphate synthase/phosphatase
MSSVIASRERARATATCLAGRSRLLIVSNRLPVSARSRGGRLRIVKSSGGLATALQQMRRDQPGLWIGWPGLRSHTALEGWRGMERRLQREGLHPILLTDEDVDGYYDGFSNGVIWPLFHHLLDRIPIDGGSWDAYQRVNARFAAAVTDLWEPGDRIWIHDYHLMLLPSLLRRRLPHARIGFFLHIPFPSTDTFRTLPWRVELLRGLLGADAIGFHTPAYADHFLAAVRQLLRVQPVRDHVWWEGRAIHVGALPMGIDIERFEGTSNHPRVRNRAETIRAEARGRKLLLGIDRLDYTKGIPRRLLAFQRLLERNPSMSDRVRFIQVAVPSRIDVRAYKTFRGELDELIGRINGEFGTVGSVPIHYLYRSVPPLELAALYRAADVMVVTPLRDGMNLVAKEFVASRTDEDGVLLLSEFAGAAAELTDALLVNPYDIDGVADAMARALTLDDEERHERMRRLRTAVSRTSIHGWARQFLRRLPHAEAEPAISTSATSIDALGALQDGRLVLRRPLTLVVDYDGTLVPIAECPDQATPDSELLSLLTALATSPEIDFHLVTGRSIENVQSWFGDVSASLWAEHGAACRRFAEPWQRLVTTDGVWMERAKAFLSDVCARTPGALVESKTTSIAWHYRMVEPVLAAAQRRRVLDALPHLLGTSAVDVIEGHMAVELRPRGVSKALVVRCLTSRDTPWRSMLVIGDDRTDEEMFSVTPRWGVTVHVGNGESRAAYRLPGPAAVRRFLTRILTAGVEGPSTVLR